MSYRYETEFPVKYIVGGIIGLLVLSAIGLAGCPSYNVYTSQMAGRAAYVKAEQDRQVRVLEARAALDSAKLNAQAEVERAKGTNEANRIMSESLGGPDNYLRWSYINMLHETAGKGDRSVIYLPTEAGMPVLEAGRRAPPRPAE